MFEELTEEELKTVDELTDQDVKPEPKYKWDEEFQREILALLLSDKHFLMQCISLIKPQYFVNDVHQNCARIAIKYFNKYKSIITRTQLNQEINDHLKDKDDESKLYFKGEINTVLEYYVPGLGTREYYQDKIVNFAKQKTLQNAFHVCLDKISKSPDDDSVWAEVHNILREAMTVEKNFDIGLDYFNTVEERYKRMMSLIENKEVFTSGFPSIDKALACGGLTKGEIASWVGISGSGKSICLVRSAVANMALGKKVLYITLEIDQDKTAERFDAQLVNSREDKGVTTKNLYDNKDVVLGALNEYVSDYEEHTRLVIKQFPAGVMDMATFRAYHGQLLLRNFKPDLVIIDYVGEMKDYPGMKVYESRQMIIRDLRGFATEEQVCVMTAMQPDRRAREVVKEGGYIDDENLADSYGQIRPLDALWSLNQIADEKGCNLIRIWVSKHRHGRSRFAFYAEQNPNTLSITEITLERYENILKKYRNEKDNKASDLVKDEFIEKELNKLRGVKNKSDNSTNDVIKDVGKKMFDNDGSYGDDENLDKE